MTDNQQIALELAKILAPTINEECCIHGKNLAHSTDVTHAKCLTAIEYYECILDQLNNPTQ